MIISHVFDSGRNGEKACFRLKTSEIYNCRGICTIFKKTRTMTSISREVSFVKRKGLLVENIGKKGRIKD